MNVPLALKAVDQVQSVGKHGANSLLKLLGLKVPTHNPQATRESCIKTESTVETEPQRRDSRHEVTLHIAGRSIGPSGLASTSAAAGGFTLPCTGSTATGADASSPPNFPITTRIPGTNLETTSNTITAMPTSKQQTVALQIRQATIVMEPETRHMHEKVKVYYIDKGVAVAPEAIIDAKDLETWKQIKPRLQDTLFNTFRPQRNLDPSLALEFMMAGPSASSLRPTGIVVCCSEPHKKQLRKILKSQTWLSSFEFQCVVVVDTLVHLSGDAGPQGDVVWIEMRTSFFEGSGTLCGRLARVEGQSQGDRVLFTIGGTVMIDRRWFAIIAAHALEAREPDLLIAPMADLDDDGASGDESESESDLDSPFIKFSDPTRSTANAVIYSYPMADPTTNMTAVYDGTLQLSGTTWQRIGSIQQPPSQSSHSHSQQSSRFHEMLDWALIDLAEHEEQHLPNVISLSGLQGTPVTSWLEESEMTASKVIINAGVSGVITGYLTDCPVYLRLGYSTLEVRQIVLETPLVRGDSGAWVFQDNKLCGHVIAGRGAVPWVYMVPAATMIEDIKLKFQDAHVQLPDLLSCFDPSTSLAIAPHSSSAPSDELLLLEESRPEAVVDPNPISELSPLLAERSNRSGTHYSRIGNEADSDRWDALEPLLDTAVTRHGRVTGDWGRQLRQALSKTLNTETSNGRIWYDQFTSTDWVYDNIADAYRIHQLRLRKWFWGNIYRQWDIVQGWVLIVIIGLAIALIAFAVDVSEATISSLRLGHCSRAWYLSAQKCCPSGSCPEWQTWADSMNISSGRSTLGFTAYLCSSIALALLSTLVTLTSKLCLPFALLWSQNQELAGKPIIDLIPVDSPEPQSYTIYCAAGSGLAGVRAVLNGLVLHGFLGFRSLFIKFVGLILSTALGLRIGKEDSLVHIAASVGNVACRLFSKYDQNDSRRREILTAAAAAGISVAFGAPIGGLIFVLEQAAYVLPTKRIVPNIVCCVVASASLRYLQPYGNTNLFQVRYNTQWQFFQFVVFVAVGVLSGVLGALFIKASVLWKKCCRNHPFLTLSPLWHTVWVALVTGAMGYWNEFGKMSMPSLLNVLVAPCDPLGNEQHIRLGSLQLCPNGSGEIYRLLPQLFIAFFTNVFLAVITIGVKVPGGIFAPLLALRALAGRLTGHLLQLTMEALPTGSGWTRCPGNGGVTAACIQPGLYGLIAAASTLGSVVRLPVTIIVVLLELTGTLEYALPFISAVLIARWVASAIEPLCFQDIFEEISDCHFLGSRNQPLLLSELGDICPMMFSRDLVIDISDSPLVPARNIRALVEHLQASGELDGGLPIVRDNILLGLGPVPDIEYALDRLEDEDNSFCFMGSDGNVLDDADQDPPDPTNFASFIDFAPLTLDIKSPMEHAYQCFVKLGLRNVCVTSNGRFIKVDQQAGVYQLSSQRGKDWRNAVARYTVLDLENIFLYLRD